MKKTELTLKQMVEAVKANSKEPWTVLGISRGTWFRSLSKNSVTMAELQSQRIETETTETETTETTETETTETETTETVPVRTIRPVPQWEPNVANEANTVGCGGVRYKYTDTEKYNEFVKEDAFRIMERALKNEITYKPAERIVKPEIPEELLQYDQIDVPYDVWTKYIDESKGEHWGTFVMRYGRFLEPKEHKSVDTSVEPRKVYPKGFLF